MQLNLPEFDIKTRKNKSNNVEVFDIFRKKYVVLTPEEWVRQHFLHYLINQKVYPPSLIGVEKGLTINKMQKRFDAIVFDNIGKPVILIEFKSPTVKLEQKTFDQVAAYNFNLKVKYLIISNGLAHYCCQMDYTKNTFAFLPDIPNFNELKNN